MNKEAKSTDPEVRRFQTALRIAGITAADSTAHHALRILQGINEKGDDYSLRDAVAIESEMEALYPDEKKAAKPVEEGVGDAT